MSRSAEIFEIVERHLAGPFVWGELDCCIACANAFQEIHGIDLMRKYRGRYKSKADAMKLVRETKGDISKLFLAAVKEFGLVPALGPQWPGDIGLVRILDPELVEVPAVAICFGPAWLCKGIRGMLVTNFAYEVWRVPQQV